MKKSIFILFCLLSPACESEPNNIVATTYIYNSSDSSCSGLIIDAEKNSSCKNMYECPVDIECKIRSDGYYVKTEYSCNPTAVCGSF